MDIAEQLELQNQLRKLEELKREVLLKVLTKDARERLANVRIANPQLAEQVEIYLVQLHQQGLIKEPLNDEKLKELLKNLTQKRETKIVRK